MTYKQNVIFVPKSVLIHLETLTRFTQRIAISSLTVYRSFVSHSSVYSPYSPRTFYFKSLKVTAYFELYQKSADPSVESQIFEKNDFRIFLSTLKTPKIKFKSHRLF